MHADHLGLGLCSTDRNHGLNGAVGAGTRPVAAPVFSAPGAGPCARGATLPSSAFSAAMGLSSTAASFAASKHGDGALPDLEPLEALTLQKYCGPTAESNWVIPGRLLVGAFPASTNDSETLYLLSAILKQGVNKFVCLQEEFRPTGVPEELWRSGQALRPYFDDVRHIVRNWQHFGFAWGQIATFEQLSFVHFPIQDCNVTDDDNVIELVRSLAESLGRGDVVYLHCWGGHGRTGTVVCILLHLLYGLDAPTSLVRCQRVHDLRECPIDVQSPQTPLQREQVVRVISKLMAQAQHAPMVRSRSPSAASVVSSGQFSDNDSAASTERDTTESSEPDATAESCSEPEPPKSTRYLSFSLPRTLSFFAFLRRAQQTDTDMVRVSA